MTDSSWKGPTAKTERCIGPVRWHQGRLQQAWEVTTITYGDGSVGVPLSRVEEWRDVPTCDGEKQDK